MAKKVWLSYTINQDTPLYGGRVENIKIHKTSSMKDGDGANDTKIETTVHVGTHIDLPYHFYENGQTIDDFDIDFWFFKKPLVVHLEPKNFVIKNELIDVLKNIKNDSYDILIVKTNICDVRGEEQYWKENYGFNPEIYEFIVKYFPQIRVFGFDSISMSSWQNRNMGKVSHRAFLNPENPILILEDMDLRHIFRESKIKEVIISPLRIDDCDGLPCTVFGFLDDEKLSI